MMNWLQQIPAERLALWVFLAGVAWQQLAQARRSLREHGQRIGALAGRIARLEAKAGLVPPAGGGDGG
jgi:hypothetical protein